jgi:hypothetical protein
MAVGLDVDVVPNFFVQYPDAVSQCQQHFNTAVRTWTDGHVLYLQRSQSQSAFYELGWACHLLQDLAVAQHVNDTSFNGHREYEDFADGKGDPARYPDLHPGLGTVPAGHAGPLGAYHHDVEHPERGWSAAQFARTLAETTY